jgi:hypothetical protein
MIPRILGRRLGLTASSPSAAECCDEVEWAEMAGESDVECAEVVEGSALPTAAEGGRPELNGAATSVFRLGYAGVDVCGKSEDQWQGQEEQ